MTESCMVMEDTQNHEVRFVHIQATKKDVEGRRKLKLTGLG